VKKAKLFLQELNKKIPSSQGMNHNLTVGDGDLIVSLMFSDRYISFILNDNILDESVDKLIERIISEA